MVKLQRAQGECLGTRSRRRTQRSAISHGEAKAAVIPVDFRMGQPTKGNTLVTCDEYIVTCGEPPELKHLSRARKRNQPRFRK